MPNRAIFTAEFLDWIDDAKPVGSGLSELRISLGPGYRVYYTRTGLNTFVVIAGGDKSTQVKDIDVAILLAKNL